MTNDNFCFKYNIVQNKIWLYLQNVKWEKHKLKGQTTDLWIYDNNPGGTL